MIESPLYFCTVAKNGRMETTVISPVSESLESVRQSARDLIATFPRDADIHIEIRSISPDKPLAPNSAASDWGESSLPDAVRDSLFLLLNADPIFETNSPSVLESWFTDSESVDTEKPIRKPPVEPALGSLSVPAHVLSIIREGLKTSDKLRARKERIHIQDTREYLAVLFETENMFRKFSREEKAALLALAVGELESENFLQDVKNWDPDVVAAMERLEAADLVVSHALESPEASELEEAEERQQHLKEALAFLNIRFGLSLFELFLWCESRLQELDIAAWILQNRRIKN